jgi:hypothetical protein
LLLDPDGEPTKPDLKIVKVNMDRTLYTWKLAVHYFRKQLDAEDRDRCFIITGSMIAWIDSPVSAEIVSTERHILDSLRTGQLGIHRHEVQTKRIYANGTTLELGARD